MPALVLRGRFVTFEGPEGSGKSTQIDLLTRRLELEGYSCTRTREPGGTTIGQQLRSMLLDPDRPELAPAAEALLLLGDRAQHVHEVIRPALAAGQCVLCDRYVDSTIAYQGIGMGLDVRTLERIARFATGGLVPDLTVLLDLNVRTGLKRRRSAWRERTGEINRIDKRNVAFHQRVRDGYLALAMREPTRFLVLDARQPPEVIAGQIWQRVVGMLDERASAMSVSISSQLPLPLGEMWLAPALLEQIRRLARRLTVTSARSSRSAVLGVTG